MSTAHVIVLAADVAVDMSVSPSQIVLCDGVDDPPDCSELNGEGNFDTVYTIEVTNNGPSSATGVTVVDTLPAAFIYGYDDGDGLYDEPGHSPTCDVGDIAPAETVTIDVYGELDVSGLQLPWQRITNQVCANTTPPRLDPDGSNNCAQAGTWVSTGPTRTIDWWSTHPNGLQACLDDSGGSIDLGFLAIEDETADGEIDATVSTDPTDPSD